MSRAGGLFGTPTGALLSSRSAPRANPESHTLPASLPAPRPRSFCEDPRTLYDEGRPDPACALYYDDTLYDNIVVRRRGQSSLGWPKPKLRVASERGRIFEVGREYKLKEFNFNSECVRLLPRSI